MRGGFDLVNRLQLVARTAMELAQQGSESLAQRPLERVRGKGLWARPLDFDRDRVVLLFFEDFDRDRLVRGDRHAIRVARRLVQAARRKQRVTGFGVAFAGLCRALEFAGYTVRIDDYALARANPNYPIGIAGYPHVLDDWRLPNPAILGPGLLDHPSIRPHLMDDPRFARYIVPCEWMRDMFAQTYPPDKLGLFFAGIDTSAWPDTSRQDKDLDFIVYDKVRWDTEAVRGEIVAPLESALRARNLTFERLTYRKYDHAQYRALLGRARGLIFLCEHETQGLAYQEALASNVPVLAWDRRRWADPSRFGYGEREVTASSVPYFDARCGERFASAEEIAPALDRFMERRQHYAPRVYVEEKLSLEASAKAYVDMVRSLLKQPS